MKQDKSDDQVFNNKSLKKLAQSCDCPPNLRAEQ